MRRDGSPGERSVTSTGWLTPDTGSWNVPSRIERCQRGRRGHDSVAERARHGVARAVAACLRHGHSAAGQHHASGSQRPVVRGDHKPSISRRDMGCTLGMPEPHAGPCGLVEQRIEHRGGAVRIGEQLPVRLFVERDAELVEEPHACRPPAGLAAPAQSPRGAPPLKSRAVTTRFETLQRPPPLMRILAPRRRAPSMTMTSGAGAKRAAVIAAINPAAPPPTTMIRSEPSFMLELKSRLADYTLQRPRSAAGLTATDGVYSDIALCQTAPVRLKPEACSLLPGQSNCYKTAQ